MKSLVIFDSRWHHMFAVKLKLLWSSKIARGTNINCIDYEHVEKKIYDNQ